MSEKNQLRFKNLVVQTAFGETNSFGREEKFNAI